MQAHLGRTRQYLLSGVSYAIPFVACGGILIALAIALVPMTATGPDFSGAPFLKMILDIGTAAFSLLVPVLGGYIAFGIADRPGLVAGFVGGAVANQTGAGFLGGLVAGFLAGFAARALKKMKVPAVIRPVMPILVIPVLSSLAVGLVMFAVLGSPIRAAMTWLSAWLKVMSTGSSVVLALVLGAMIAFDMGGPVNKVAFFFGAAMIQQGNYAVMGACAAAICVPPIGLGLATLVSKRLWSAEEREAGWAGLAMGMVGITEGAIPFAAADPVRVIPTIMLGSAVGSVVAMLGGVGDHAPHGGPIVLPVVDNRLAYVAAIAAGSITVALVMNALRAAGAARKEGALP
ncbi:MAG TPA: fructose-specific PTS transporter subunit EIIC [Thermoanaerobaculia bacterium]|nr:fructose-specific PTS transporter subunit EIIC [Thermoanaerobaculia bacterium]HQR66915.1 fructose-specific PTS transporter subunit EIIC [Thermoanaerobaculia bacterium]